LKHYSTFILIIILHIFKILFLFLILDKDLNRRSKCRIVIFDFWNKRHLPVWLTKKKVENFFIFIFITGDNKFLFLIVNYYFFTNGIFIFTFCFLCYFITRESWGHNGRILACMCTFACVHRASSLSVTMHSSAVAV